MKQIDKRLFNPDLWGVNSGLFVPKWTIPPKPIDDLGRDVITYSTFRELYPGEDNSEEIIESGFGNFWLNDILQTLAKLNYIISFSQYQKTTKEELQIAIHFLTETAVFNFLEHKEVRKIITRQQILANIRLAFLYASREESAKKVFGNEKEFGKLIYRVTDFLEGYTRYLDKKNPTERDRQMLYMTFARNMFFNEHSTFILSLSRYWYIFNKVANSSKYKAKQLNKMFNTATGTEFNYLLAVGFAIWGFYCDANKKQRLSKPHEFLFSENYFKNTQKKVRVRLDKALDLLAGDYDYFIDAFRDQNKHEGKHFFQSPIWNKPILRNEGKAHFILDVNYLEERLSEGAFWFIFDDAIAKGKSNNYLSELKGKWGDIFEGYVNDLIKHSFPTSPKRVYSEIDGDDTGGVDFIIVYPDTLYFIEVTTKQVRYNEWIEAQYSDVKKSLERLLVKDKPSKGRVTKLKGSIEKVRSGEIKLNGFDVSAIKHFVPVVLFEKSPPMHRRLWHLYDNILKENGISDRKFLDDLDFWDIEELEMLMADILKGESLPEILAEREKQQYFKDSIRNFYIIKRKHFEKHPLIKEAFDEMTEGFTKILFNPKKRKDST